MKELSIEEKAKAYDEIIKKANKMHHENCEACKACIEELVPELRESEDEKIRKTMIEGFEDYQQPDAEWWNGIKVKDCIAWLEKQGKKESQKVSIWKHWKDGIAGGSEGEQIFLIKNGLHYSISSCLGYECDYIELSELDKLLSQEKQGEQNSYGKRRECVDCQFNYAGECKGSCAMKIFKMKTPEESLGVDSDTYNKIVDECIYGEQKPTDKVKPKFHEGEWITNGDYTWKIVEVKPLDYILQSQDGNIVDDTISHVDAQFHSFTIEDAKDGDVLCCESGWTCIFKALNSGNISFSSYCFMDGTGWFCGTGSESHTLDKAFIKAYNGNIYPATKKQRDTLMKAIIDAGYTFDFEKKELRKIEQNPAWSEEDEEQARQIERIVLHEGYTQKLQKQIADWLNSLKDRVQPKSKQEWSEEDDKMLEKVIKALSAYGDKLQYEGFCHNKDVIQEYIDWLKKKQGEQKPIIVPKFRVGDTIRVKDSHAEYTIDSISDGLYHGNGWFLAIGKEDDYELVEHKFVGEEDERIRKHLIKILEEGRDNITLNRIGINACISWLKSLRPQSTWKPSEELLDVFIKNATDFFESNFNPLTDGGVIGAFDDKKKMIEEFKEYMKEEGFNEEWI